MAVLTRKGVIDTTVASMSLKLRDFYNQQGYIKLSISRSQIPGLLVFS